MGSQERKTTRRIAGLNIQYPWSRYILDGDKTVETRHYPLPEKHMGKELALIETPGKEGKKAGIETRIIGIIIVEKCIHYETKEAWIKDKKRHLVEDGDELYGYSKNKEKWGWVVKVVRAVEPQMPPKVRGIKYAKECIVSY